MRKNLFSLVGIVIVLVLLEVMARGCSNYQLSNAMHSRTTNVRKVTVASGDVPYLFHEGIFGNLSNGSVSFHDIVASPTPVSVLRVTASKLQFSRGALVSGGAKLTGKGPYLVTVVLSANDIRNSTNQTVAFNSAYLHASTGKGLIDAKPTVAGRTIIATESGTTLKIPLPTRNILPCDPEGVSVQNALVVSCISETLPPIIAAAVK